MFELLKKLWREAKERSESSSVVVMPPAVFHNEHDTTQVEIREQESRCPPLSFGHEDDCRTIGVDTEETMIW